MKTRYLKKAFLLVGFLAAHIINGYAQMANKLMPVLIEKEGRHMLVVDGKPYFILGGQAHNSSAWPAMLPQLWQAVEKMHANTLEVPVYWEQVESQPGKFDFSIVDALLHQADEHKTRLVLLWFGTWKNGSNHYMPAWMKFDAAKHPNITGNNGAPVDSPSPHNAATLNLDIKAFTAVMNHLKAVDVNHTVIMVQVENEAGSWGSVRDYSSAAQQLFNGMVPATLLKPATLETLHAVAKSGTWQQVFGNNADEYFHAWSIAQYVGKVAAAGKAVYPLPLYVNAALRDPLTNPAANTYESGGPTDNVLPIWKAAAPAIDILAPDIYLTGSEKILKVLDLYKRNDNALFVPEVGLTPANAIYLYSVIARGGIGFSPFGIDGNTLAINNTELINRLAPFAKEYAVLKPVTGQIAQWGFDGKITAAVEQDDHAEQTIELGLWKAIVSFGQHKNNDEKVVNPLPGKLMIIALARDKFLLIGSECHITFIPAGKNLGKAWQYLSVEEGSLATGVFKPFRILNGDETDFGGPRFGAMPVVNQVTLLVR